MRDTVSGAAVRGDSLLYQDNDGLPFSPPTQLHTRIVEGRLGAPSFNGTMLWCLTHDGLTKRTPKRTYAERLWYVGDDVQRDLYAHFQRDIVAIVLMMLVGGTPVEDAIDGTGYSKGFIFKCMGKMKAHILEGLDNRISA